MAKGVPRLAQLPMYFYSNKQVKGWLQILTATPLVPALSIALVKLIEHLLRMCRVGLALLHRNPHRTMR